MLHRVPVAGARQALAEARDDIVGREMELPTLAVFSEEVARALSGKVVELETGDWPASAVLTGEHPALLIRAHLHAFVLSLPVTGSWRVTDPAQWDAARAEIVRATLALAPVVSMSDVIAYLVEESAREGGRACTTDFPGDLLPTEAWMYRGGGRISFTQNPASVTVTVWAAGAAHAREIADPASLEGLSAWADDRIVLQVRGAEAATREIAEAEARRAAIPAPDFDEVMAAFRDGVSFQIGGGRTFSTYEMRDGQVIVINYDEGHGDEFLCSEAELREAVVEERQIFGQVLEDWRAGLYKKA